IEHEVSRRPADSGLEGVVGVLVERRVSLPRLPRDRQCLDGAQFRIRCGVGEGDRHVMAPNLGWICQLSRPADAGDSTATIVAAAASRPTIIASALRKRIRMAITSYMEFSGPLFPVCAAENGMWLLCRYVDRPEDGLGNSEAGGF